VRYALISDVHANLEALEATLDEINRLGCDEVICLGDIVGYGADPSECIALLRSRRVVCLAGNHDFAAVGRIATEFFNYEARCSIAWTRSALSADERDFLSDLPLTLRRRNFICFHGALPRPDAFEYILSPSDAVLCFQHLDARVGFYGHTHVPCLVREEEPLLEPLSTISLDEQMRRLVNVGSVGQPRDGQPLACVMEFDSTTGQGQLHRVAYDVGKAAQKILAAGLPEINAYRLLVGR